MELVFHWLSFSFPFVSIDFDTVQMTNRKSLNPKR